MQDAICKMVEQWRQGINPYFVYEFSSSILVVNEIQFYRGHAMLLLKSHAREIYDLPQDEYEMLSRELYLASRAIAATFKPAKMNFQCLGNQEPHVHWHIIPRYDADPNARQQPFSESIRGEISMEPFKIGPQEALQMASELRKYLELS